MKRAHNPNARLYTRRDPWWIRFQPSDKVLMIGTTLLILAAMAPVLSGCVTPVITKSQGKATVLSYTEGEYRRSSGHKRASIQLAGKADEVCPAGWRKISESTKPVTAEDYEHLLTIVCE